MKGLWWRLSLFFVGILILVILRLTGHFDWLTLAYVQEKAYELRLFIQLQPIAASFWYLIFVSVATAFFVPITSLATVASGYLFGVVLGTVYTVCAVTLGSVAVFIMVRHGIGRSVQREYGQYLNGFNGELHDHGAHYLLVMHILPMTPTVLINIVAGLSTMSLWSFTWATAIGIIPGTVVHTLIGKELVTLTSLADIISWRTAGVLVLLALLVLVPFLMERYAPLKKIKRVNDIERD